MSTQANIQDNWSPEPELRDPAPRRHTNAGFEDFNRPNVVVGTTIGGVMMGIGFMLFFIGIANLTPEHYKVGYIIGGLLLLVVGAVPVILWPARMKAYLDRSENLVVNGVPLAARIVSVSNLTGDSPNGRTVKYQITLPSGEMTHREINADDRALPRIIPGNATALFEPRSADIELYCALPFRAVQRSIAPPVNDALSGLPMGRPSEIGVMGRLEEAIPVGAAAQNITQSLTPLGGSNTAALEIEPIGANANTAQNTQPVSAVTSNDKPNETPAPKTPKKPWE